MATIAEATIADYVATPVSDVPGLVHHGGALRVHELAPPGASHRTFAFERRAPLAPLEVTVRQLGFHEGGGGKESGTVVHEGSLALGALLAARPELVRGLRVLELGCGCGVGGLVAAAAGARSVLLTDHHPRFAEGNLLANVRHNAQLNGWAVAPATGEGGGTGTAAAADGSAGAAVGATGSSAGVAVAHLDWNGDVHAQLSAAVGAAAVTQQPAGAGGDAASSSSSGGGGGGGGFAGFDVVIGSDLAFFRNNAKTGDAPQGLVAAVRAALRTGGRLVHMGPCRPPRRNKQGKGAKAGLAQSGGSVAAEQAEQLSALHVARSRHAAYFGGLCGEGGIGAVELSAFGWARVAAQPGHGGTAATAVAAAAAATAAATAASIVEAAEGNGGVAAGPPPPPPEPGAGGVAEMVCITLLAKD